MSTARDIRQGVDLHVQEALARSGLILDDSDVKVIDAARMPRGVLDVDDVPVITGWGPDDET